MPLSNASSAPLAYALAWLGVRMVRYAFPDDSIRHFTPVYPDAIHAAQKPTLQVMENAGTEDSRQDEVCATGRLRAPQATGHATACATRRPGEAGRGGHPGHGPLGGLADWRVAKGIASFLVIQRTRIGTGSRISLLHS